MRATATFLLGLVLVSSSRAQDDLARELPRIAPTDPAEAMKSFQIRPGFRIDRVAEEPRVTDPVSACYDADGRLYVVEMRGYPFPEDRPTGKVRRLEDRDGDGHYEHSDTFIDGLNWPTSVVPYDGGVFVLAPPELILARDDNGDGVADSRRVVFQGFGTGNVQALANNLLWGPDGWIYGVGGGNGGDIAYAPDTDRPTISIRGRDFRFRPDGSAFEAVSGGGQFGHSFDDWGHRFTCNNSNHIRQIVFPGRELDRNPHFAGSAALIDIGVEGSAAPVFRISQPEPWRIVRTRQRAADPEYRRRLPPSELVATGFFTSATGVTIYRGSAYPAELRGNAFIGDVGGNLIHRKRLEPDGPIFRAVRADEGVEFLAATDNWFRPVNFANTPSGTLLVLDMYRETIEHPLSIPEPIKKHLDLQSGQDRGRLYEILPGQEQRRRAPRLSTAPTQALVDALADPDAWWRETAQRLLLERRDPEASLQLRKLAADRPTELGRIHALWSLDALGGLEADQLLTGLTDSSPRVREASVALVRAGTPLAADARVAEAVVKLVDDPDAMVRLRVAVALGEITEPAAIPALARLVVTDGSDRWIRAAILSSLGRHQPGDLLLALESRGEFLDSPLGREWLDELAALIGSEANPAAVAALLERSGGASGVESPRARAVLLGLGRGLGRSGHSLREVLEGPAGAIVRRLTEKAAGAVYSELPDGERIEAIRVVALGPADRALEVLPDRLGGREPAEVQMAALRALGSVADPRVAPEILARWATLSPAIRNEAAEVLLARPERVAALIDAVASGAVAPADLDPARKGQLLANRDPRLRDRAAKAFGTIEKADRQAVVAAFRPALSLPPDQDRGRAVFVRACATCHQAEGQGIAVGPDLASVTGRTPEDLVLHVFDPNREVPPTYLTYTVATRDGRILSGLIAEESATSVTLKRAQGLTDVVPRSEIEEMRSTGLSLMPENLETQLVPQDMADLIAYLQRLRTAK